MKRRDQEPGRDEAFAAATQQLEERREQVREDLAVDLGGEPADDNADTDHVDELATRLETGTFETDRLPEEETPDHTEPTLSRQEDEDSFAERVDQIIARERTVIDQLAG